MFAPATEQADIELPQPGRYIVKCVDIQDAPDKGYGPGVKWVFQLIDPPTGLVVQSREGTDYEMWQFTSTKMSPRSNARPIIEAVLGRPLDTANREVPDSRLLIGRSMIAVVIYEKKEDGSDKAVVSTCQPYNPPGAAPVATQAPAARPRPAANGSGEQNLLEQVKGAMRKAEILQTPHHLTWLSTGIDNLSDSDLYQLLGDIQADIQAA
jgi:hypothetical protein